MRPTKLTHYLLSMTWTKIKVLSVKYSTTSLASANEREICAVLIEDYGLTFVPERCREFFAKRSELPSETAEPEYSPWLGRRKKSNNNGGEDGQEQYLWARLKRQPQIGDAAAGTGSGPANYQWSRMRRNQYQWGRLKRAEA